MDAAVSEETSRWSSSIVTAAGTLLTIVALWWTIEIADTYLLGDALQRNGIVPRQTGGFDGILWSPFLHSDFGHLMSNTFPFLILSGLVMLRGFRRWVTITLIGMFLGGFLTWLIGGTGNHIGASGIIYAYFGALFGAAFFERRPAALAPALVALVMYTTTVVVGLVPQDSVSWEGHLSGFIAGIVAARLLAEPRPSRPDPDADVDLIFGGEEPWKLS
ncbi:MAG: rhomboid family intramembrane serine protease [Acidimicrobiales bacterium]